MLEYKRDSRVEISAWSGELRGLTSSNLALLDLDDVIPPLIEKRPHRRHIGPHQLKVLAATDRFRLRLIRNGLEF